MVDYPIYFEAEAETDSGEEVWSLESSGGLNTEMSPPEEFGGEADAPSPEDLFNASLASCILATFKITAERKDLDYRGVEVTCETVLARNEDGRPVMKKSEIEVKVTGVSSRDLAEEVGEVTEKNCFIHNSVNTEVETDFKFRD